MRERNLLLDYLKGAAIFLVVWGHTMQYSGTTDFDYFSNPVFIIIYSFHMPLFIAISGYLFFQSQAKRSFGQLVQAKIKQILVPQLCWAAILLVITNRRALFYFLLQGKSTNILTLDTYLGYVTSVLWFLGALLICSLLGIVVNKKLNDSIWAYAAVTLLVLVVVPNGYSLFMVKYMLPYFFAGYLYHKYQARLARATTILTCLSFLAFPLLLLAWRKEAYIYVGGPAFSLLHVHNLLVVLYRYLIGGFGIILFTTIINGLFLSPKMRLLGWLGTTSLGIYLFDFVINSALIERLHLPSHHVALYSLVFTPLLGLGVALVCGGLTQATSRLSLLNTYLLGGRNKPKALPETVIA